MGKRKNYETEWSFSFGNMGDSIARWAGAAVDEEDITESSFSEPLGDATGARIVLDGAVGRLTVDGVEGMKNLFEADARHIGEMKLNVSGDPVKTVRLHHNGRHIHMHHPFSGKHHDLYTNVRLNTAIPMSVAVDGGVGPARLDLSNLRLTGLDLDGGVGETKVKLPAMPNSYRVQVDGGVGRTVLYIPDGAAVIVDIDGGLGKSEIVVPPGAAVRVEVDGTLGGVEVPSHLKTVRGRKNYVLHSGTWQTPGYEAAERQIIIRVDGGVGKVEVRTEPEVTVV